MEMTQDTQAFALANGQRLKAQADTTIQAAAHNVIQSAFMEMFKAGYARALVDHGLTPTETEESTPA